MAIDTPAHPNDERDEIRDRAVFRLLIGIGASATILGLGLVLVVVSGAWPLVRSLEASRVTLASLASCLFAAAALLSALPVLILSGWRFGLYDIPRVARALAIPWVALAAFLVWLVGLGVLFYFTHGLLSKPPAPPPPVLAKSEQQAGLEVLYAYLNAAANGERRAQPGKTGAAFLDLIRSLVQMGSLPAGVGEGLITRIRDKAIDKAGDLIYEVAKAEVLKLLGLKDGASPGAPVINVQVDACCPKCCVATPGPSLDRITLGGEASFDFNHSDLKEAAKKALDHLVERIHGADVQAIHVTGHTDDVGSDETNDRLSERRSSAVRDYLGGKGVPLSRIDAQGRGKREPVASNKTACGRERNRRVEVQVEGSRKNEP